MKHVITFEEEDLLQYIRDMLAMRGVAPVGELKIETETIGVSETVSPDELKTIHVVSVVCRECDPLTHCPMCKHTLVEVQEAPPVVDPPHRAVTREPEPEEPVENVTLDASLGETLEPPPPPIRSSRNEDNAGPSIASLRAQSERVRREREPTLPKRPRGSKT